MIDVLVMFSGGRDSLLATALLIEEEFRVNLITFDNGHSEYVERAVDTAQYLQRIYGSDKCKVLGIMKTAQLFSELISKEWNRKSAERITLYPTLQTYQSNCTACRLAMYTKALEVCGERGYHYLAEGARRSQGFFIELPEAKSRLESICLKFGVKLLMPVYELDDDQKRKRMLCDRGLTTKTLEPQCNLGCALKTPLDSTDISDLVKYMEVELLPSCEDHLAKLFKNVEN